jgi:hypothetical protein
MVPDRQRTGCPRLWISYLWSTGEERDFTYLITRLKDVNITASYDSLHLQPDSRLVERIAQRLLSIECDGWMYILTHQILSRGTCAHELITAIDDTLLRIGSDVPIVGLLHGISPQHVPPILRLRPCLSLGDPDWTQRLSLALQQRGPAGGNAIVKEETRFIWKIHSCLGGDPARVAIEVGPRSESIPYWRFAIPKPFHPVRWGVGMAAGGEISPIKFAVARGSGSYGNCEVSWFGAANSVSNTESAYVEFCRPLPDFVCFGPAEGPLSPPGTMEILRIKRS